MSVILPQTAHLSCPFCEARIEGLTPAELIPKDDGNSYIVTVACPTCERRLGVHLGSISEDGVDPWRTFILPFYVDDDGVAWG